MSKETFESIDGRVTIYGDSLEDCKQKAYSRYGTNYKLVNHTYKYNGGFLGFFQKEICIACFQLNERPQTVTRPVYPQGSYDAKTQMRMQQSLDVLNKGLSDQPGVFDQSREAILSKLISQNNNNSQMLQFASEFAKFKTELKEMIDSGSYGKEVLHKNLERIKSILEENEFTKEYIADIMGRIKENVPISKLDDFDMLQKKVIDMIGNSFTVDDVELSVRNSPNLIVLVGPTGVGKTTTVAKMGSMITLKSKEADSDNGKQPVIRMITADMMRVAAEIQLSRWAAIINVKVDKVENSQDLKDLCERYSVDSDYIFVDTAGFSPNDYENIARTRKIIEMKKFKGNVYLTFSAGTTAKDLGNIFRNFESFNFNSCIVTKCDETSGLGRVISVLSEKKKSVAWITTGQEVVGTIEKASVAWFLKNLSGFEIDTHYIEENFGNAENRSVE